MLQSTAASGRTNLECCSNCSNCSNWAKETTNETENERIKSRKLPSRGKIKRNCVKYVEPNVILHHLFGRHAYLPIFGTDLHASFNHKQYWLEIRSRKIHSLCLALSIDLSSSPHFSFSFPSCLCESSIHMLADSFGSISICSHSLEGVRLFKQTLNILTNEK